MQEQLQRLVATPPLKNIVVKATRDNTTGTYKGYALSGITLVSPTVLNVSYYDDYAFMGTNGIPTSTDTNFGYEAGSDFDIRYEESAKTLLTGTLTAKLDDSATPTYLYSVMYYDYRGRVIQTKSNNHLTGGIEKEYVAYNFTGQPMRKKHVHSATGKTPQTELYSYAYDHAGRLVTTKHQLTVGTEQKPEITLVENTYDELGRLKTSKKNDQANLNTTYAYNVRSWIKSSASPLFSQTLYYNDSYGSNTPRYNGNISATSWTVSGDKTRGYNFTYDNLSRLTAAGYLEEGIANTSYGTSYAYDKHGNMTNLVRNGRTGTSTFGTVDNLSMSYAGNQLIKADDTGTNVTLSASMDFKNNSTAAKEYFYDLNGNLTQDLNKGITGITYNLLNLPQNVTIKNTLGQATNTYMYAADGRKLRTVQQWGGTNSKQTDYVGNVIYEGGALKRILVDGGYIEGDAYYFYLADHLGNNRVVANASGGIVQTNHYYPFGMSFAEGVASSGQPYKYNGKELDTERGLNLYDYSARLMDPALGRFSTMDPLAEKMFWASSYVYCKNNPVKYIDPDGKREWPVNPNYKGFSYSHENNWHAPRSHGRLHQGIDVNHTGGGNTDQGAPIVATHNGTVIRVGHAGDGDGGGNRIKIISSDGKVSTSYMHLDAVSSGIKVGNEIKEGQQIGTMGRSGALGQFDKNYKSHLHYEISIDGTKINPANGANHLVDPQQIIDSRTAIQQPERSYSGGTLPEVIVVGDSPEMISRPLFQIPASKIKIPEIEPIKL